MNLPSGATSQWRFKSTLSIRGETALAARGLPLRLISIHSPHVGRDPWPCIWAGPPDYFNPLSPCGERLGAGHGTGVHQDFNPLSPCGERRPGHRARRPHGLYFNPLSPCGERQHLGWRAAAVGIFQSTLPVWGETTCRREQSRAARKISIPSPHTGRDGSAQRVMETVKISIPSPHTGRDTYLTNAGAVRMNFNPLSPYGERRPSPIRPAWSCLFQSPLPIRGETSGNHDLGRH